MKKIIKQAKTAEQMHFEIVCALADCQPILAHGSVIIPSEKWHEVIKKVGQLRS